MNVYIWQRVDHLTHNYHDEGGIVVIAHSLDRAKEIVQGIRTKVLFDSNSHGECTPEELPYPTMRYELVADRMEGAEGLKFEQPESFIIFPDSGCC